MFGVLLRKEEAIMLGQMLWTLLWGLAHGSGVAERERRGAAGGTP